LVLAKDKSDPLSCTKDINEIFNIAVKSNIA